MINIIAAISRNGVIGKNNTLPFDYPEDLKYFRTSTINSTIICGRKTFEGIGRALPKRRNIVISSKKIEADNIETFQSIKEALESCYAPVLNITTGAYDSILTNPVWICGGHSIYSEVLNKQLANEIYLTLTPDVIEGDVVTFPWINPLLYSLSEIKPLPSENPTKLKLAIYKRI